METAQPGGHPGRPCSLGWSLPPGPSPAPHGRGAALTSRSRWRRPPPGRRPPAAPARSCSGSAPWSRLPPPAPPPPPSGSARPRPAPTATPPSRGGGGLHQPQLRGLPASFGRPPPGVLPGAQPGRELPSCLPGLGRGQAHSPHYTASPLAPCFRATTGTARCWAGGGGLLALSKAPSRNNTNYPLACLAGALCAKQRVGKEAPNSTHPFPGQVVPPMLLRFLLPSAFLRLAGQLCTTPAEKPAGQLLRVWAGKEHPGGGKSNAACPGEPGNTRPSPITTSPTDPRLIQLLSLSNYSAVCSATSLWWLLCWDSEVEALW